MVGGVDLPAWILKAVRSEVVPVDDVEAVKAEEVRPAAVVAGSHRFDVMPPLEQPVGEHGFASDGATTHRLGVVAVDAPGLDRRTVDV